MARRTDRADDTNVYVRSKRSGERVMASITRFIEGKLRLKVNRAKSAVAKPERRHFLGFRLRRQPLDGTVEVLLSQRSKDRVAEAVKTRTPRTWGKSLEACITNLNVFVLGWIAFFWICTTAEERTFKQLDAHIRRRLRALVLKHWKRKRTIVRRLVKLKMQPSTAWRRVYSGRKRLWALSHDLPVKQAWRNTYFAERGLESLVVRWRMLQDRAVAAPAWG